MEMTTNEVPHPPIVSRDQWLAERKKLLAHEKELTKQLDRGNAERRRLPMAKIEKGYAYNAQRGWRIPCFSSFGSDFNYAFHVTLDANVAPVEYNYRAKAEMLARKT